MSLVVIAQQIADQPFVGLLLGFRLMKVIQGFVGFLDGTERAFHLPFRACRRARPILARRDMRLPRDGQRLHDVLENPALGDWAIVQVDHLRPSLERRAGIGLRRHGVEQEAQGCFRIFAIDAVVFDVSHAAPVIDHAEQRQCRHPFGGVDPL
eukprot:16519-Eustigmatos_ZCMA.PRE.1